MIYLTNELKKPLIHIVVVVVFVAVLPHLVYFFSQLTGMSLTKAKAEKSRVHAKQRRTEEAREIAEIAELLPLPSSVTKRLDKSSILRLAITFLRLKQYVGEGRNNFIKSIFIITFIHRGSVVSLTFP